MKNIRIMFLLIVSITVFTSCSSPFEKAEENDFKTESSRSSSYYSDRFSVSPGIQPMGSYRSGKKLLNQGIYEFRVNAMIPRPYSTVEILDTRNAVVARYSISSNTNTFKIDKFYLGEYSIKITNKTSQMLYMSVELKKVGNFTPVYKHIQNFSPRVNWNSTFTSNAFYMFGGNYDIEIIISSLYQSNPRATVELINSQGKVVKSQYMTSYHKWLRTDSLSSGNYTLRIKNHTGNPLFIEVELRKYK